MHRKSYRNLVNFRATIFSILIVRCGYFSLSSFTHQLLSLHKKKLTIIMCLPGHRERIMVNVREHKAASCIRGYGEDHPSASDASRPTFLHSTELRNEAVQLSQDRTVPKCTV